MNNRTGNRRRLVWSDAVRRHEISRARFLMRCGFLLGLGVTMLGCSSYGPPEGSGGARRSVVDSVSLNQLAPGNSPETSREVRRLVDSATDLLLYGNDPSGAVDRLTEAQTIDGWAQTERAPDVLFWLGHAYERLDEPAAAMSTYRRMLMKYPDAPRAGRARQRLTRLESEYRPD